jgi:hypothetical protein
LYAFTEKAREEGICIVFFVQLRYRRLLSEFGVAVGKGGLLESWFFCFVHDRLRVWIERLEAKETMVALRVVGRLRFASVLLRGFRSIQSVRCWLGIITGVCVLPVTAARAHQVPYTRVIHMILHDDALEIYINVLLPSHPKMRVWMALFDRDRDGKLDAQEQMALGRFLAPKIVHGFALLANKKVCSLVLREVQNSRLRGSPQQRKYSWDYRFQIKILSLQEGLNRLRLAFPLLSIDEEVPIALITQKGFLHRTMRPKSADNARSQARSLGKDRAICRIHRGNDHCTFWIHKVPRSLK